MVKSGEEGMYAERRLWKFGREKGFLPEIELPNWLKKTEVKNEIKSKP